MRDLRLLLADISGGDKIALDTLYRATHRKMRLTILGVVRIQCDAEDILQEVYISVFRKAHQYKPDFGTPMTWLISIARNRSIDHLRRVDHIDHSVDETLLSLRPDPAACAFTQLQTKQQDALLTRLLSELDPRARTALRLAFVEGCAYDAVAHALAVPKGTAHSIIRRTLTRLRKRAQLLEELRAR